jgi:hypothetical protein
MFNAANCIDPKYQGYGMQPEAVPDVSQEAAVASAAGNVLIKLVPKGQNARGAFAGLPRKDS